MRSTGVSRVAYVHARSGIVCIQVFWFVIVIERFEIIFVILYNSTTDFNCNYQIAANNGYAEDMISAAKFYFVIGPL